MENNWADSETEITEKIFGTEDSINKWDFINLFQEQHPVM